MIIETKRLILRPFERSDAEDLFEYLKEPAVNCFACMKLDSLEEASEEAESQSKETDFYSAIVLKESGKVIGEIDAAPETTAPEIPDAAVSDAAPPFPVTPGPVSALPPWPGSLPLTGAGSIQ